MTDTSGPANPSLPAYEPLRPGQLLADRFELVRHLGRGGLGHVWLARDIPLDGDLVACKILREDFFYDRCAIADMKREVLLTRKLRHRNILAVYTFWETPTHRFITMEYVDGQSLSDALTVHRRPFALDQILPWVEQVCQALDYAHSEHVFHRDVKPGNVLLGSDGYVRLADFGIARTAQQLRTRFTGEMTSGTLLYISPEQLLGEELDARSDLYSLAASVYELVSGAPPFYEGALITQIQLKPPAPIAHLNKAINDVLLRALSKNPLHRQASCGEFYVQLKEEVEHWHTEHPAESLPTVQTPVLTGTASWDPDAQTIHMVISTTERHKPRIGMLLVKAGILTEKQLGNALDVQERTGEKLGTILVNLGYMAEEALLDAVGSQLQVPFIRLEDETFDPAIAGFVGAHIARARRCIPVRREKDQIIMAMADPLDLATLNEVERLCKARVDIRIAPETAIMAAIDRVYGADTAQDP
jgi:hypothetical protein